MTPLTTLTPAKTTHWLRREAIFCIALLTITAAMLAKASEVTDPVDFASRVEKLGVVGVLICIIIVLSGCLIYIMRMLFSKILKLFDENIKTLQELRDVVRQCRHNSSGRNEV